MNNISASQLESIKSNDIRVFIQLYFKENNIEILTSEGRLTNRDGRTTREIIYDLYMKYKALVEEYNHHAPRSEPKINKYGSQHINLGVKVFASEHFRETKKIATGRDVETFMTSQGFSLNGLNSKYLVLADVYKDYLQWCQRNDFLLPTSKSQFRVRITELRFPVRTLEKVRMVKVRSEAPLT